MQRINISFATAVAGIFFLCSSPIAYAEKQLYETECTTGDVFEFHNSGNPSRVTQIAKNGANSTIYRVRFSEGSNPGKTYTLLPGAKQSHDKRWDNNAPRSFRMSVTNWSQKDANVPPDQITAFSCDFSVNPNGTSRTTGAKMFVIDNENPGASSRAFDGDGNHGAFVFCDQFVADFTTLEAECSGQSH